MSIHVKPDPEAEAEFRRQRLLSSLVSIITGLLILTTLSMVFYMFSIVLFKKQHEPFIVSFHEDENVAEQPVEKAVSPKQIKQKPSSPPAKITPPLLTANPPQAKFKIPEIKVQTDISSLTFSDSTDFGEGFGSQFGEGFTSQTTVNIATTKTTSVKQPVQEKVESKELNFVGNKFRGQRVVFVIDYSRSMRGSKIELVKKELTKTIQQLPDGMKFQLIYFADPAWTAGAKFSDLEKTGGFQDIKIDGRTYKWSATTANQGPTPKLKIEWIKARKSTRESMVEDLQNSPLIYGTKWRYPLTRACEIYPKPHSIVFLTDGIAIDNWQVAQDISKIAKQQGTTINTISLREPKARKSLEFLANETGGTFSLINEKGEIIEQ